MNLPKAYYDFRRWALRHFVPEWYWPAEVNLDGAVIRLRNTPYSFGVRLHLKKGLYEKGERQFIAQTVKPGMQVLELGGSIGVVTAVLAHKVGPTGRVVSVEASPRLAAFSRGWLEKDGRVKVVVGYAFPVWQLPEGLRVESFTGDEVSLGGRVDFNVSDGAAANPPAGEASSRTYDIETLCRENDLRPDALVIDIEGSEALLLKTPPRLPATIKIVVAEMHPWAYPNGEADLERMMNTLREEGFALGARTEDVVLLQRD